MAEAPKWDLERMDKGCRAFFWAGSDDIHGGKCPVAWWLGGNQLELAESGIPTAMGLA